MRIREKAKIAGMLCMICLMGSEMPWDAPKAEEYREVVTTPNMYQVITVGDDIYEGTYIDMFLAEFPPAIQEIDTEEAVDEPDYIAEIGMSYGIDPAILRAIIQIESGGDPHAVGDGGVSIGLCQIQPRWHTERMNRLGVTDLTDPYENVLVAADLISELYAQYGDIYMALSAYNSGQPYASWGYAEMVIDIAYGGEENANN